MTHKNVSELVDGGRSAFRRGAMKEATAAFEVAQATSKATMLDPAVLAELGAAYVELGQFEEGYRSLEQAIGRAQSNGDLRTKAVALYYWLELNMWLGADREAHTAIDEGRSLVDRFTRDDDQIGLARAWRLMCAGLGGAEAEAAGERALAYARASGDRQTEVELFHYIASMLDGGPTPVEVALHRCDEFVAVAGEDEMAVAGIFTLGDAPLEVKAGREENARRFLSRAAQIFDDLGLTLWKAAGWTQSAAELELMFGHPAEAETLLRSGLNALDRLGETGYWTSSFWAVLSRALIDQHRFDEAQESLASSEATGDTSSVGSNVIWLRLHARLHAEDGNLREAEDAARAAIAKEDPFAVNGRADAFADLGEVLITADRRDDASRAFTESLILYREKGNLLSSSRVERRLAQV